MPIIAPNGGFGADNRTADGHEPSLMVLDWLPLSRHSFVAVHLNARSDEVSCIQVYRERALKMKHTALLLLLGLALLPHSVLADQAPVSVCVNTLEQLEALKTVAPVYKLTGGQQRQYIADADRPAEVARLTTIIADSCSAKPKHRQREESEAEQLHLVRSPGCMQDRDRLSMMEKKDARTPEDDLARTRKRVLAQCPDADLTNVWLVEWIPIPVSPNG
jgi:hypothetical protein